MERTLAIVKPDGTKGGLTGKIMDRIEKEGFNILAIKKLHMSKAEASRFYEEHSAQPFFEGLVDFMTSGSCYMMALEREDAISAWRQIIGSTNPANADEGTIRKLYGKDVQNNVAHGSDSTEASIREISYFFSEVELISS